MPTSRSAAATPSASSTRPNPARISHALVTPRLSSASLTNTRTTIVPPVSPPTAASTSRPPGAAAVRLLPACASRTAGLRGACSPSTVPSARKTLAGRPSTLISWPTLARSSAADGAVAMIALIC